MRCDLDSRIFHAEFGDRDAPTLVLVHGFPTSNIAGCDVVDTLASDRRMCVGANGVLRARR